jgi:ABC-type glycerol-3-phosphate transport system substrate-binding protein
LVLASQGSLYEYDISERHLLEKFDFAGINMVVGRGKGDGMLLPLADGRIGWLSPNYSEEERYSELRLIRPREEGEEVAVKETLVMAGLSAFFDGALRKAIMDFNSTHPRYRIETREYGAEDYHEGIRQLNMDIATGKGADIIILPQRFSLDLFATKGVLVDLYPFIDGDARMTRGDFQENIMMAYETGGQLFAMPLSYRIRTQTAAQSEIGNINSWNLDEMITYVNGKLPGATVFDENSKSGVLNICLRANGDALVDWNSTESAFQRDLFIKILHFANQFTPDEFFEYDMDIIGRIMEQGQVTLMQDYIRDFSSYQFNKALFGGSAVYPGYPSENKNGNLIESFMVMAINDKCRDKDAAWEFISSMLNQNIQIEQSRSGLGGFPILKDAFEELAAREMEATYVTDENGAIKEVPKGTIGLSSDFQIEYFAVTEEEMQGIRDLLSSAEKIAIYDSQILAIVTEEAQSFFAGVASAEQAADVAENRIRTYVNEMR